MKSLTSLIGWLLLVAVLAVPSFLFYNWWTKNKQQSSAELSQGQTAANPFPSQDKHAAFQPVKSTAAPAALPAQSAMQPRPSASAQPPVQAARPAVQPPGQIFVATAAVQALPLVQSATAAVSVSVSTGVKPASYYAPKGDRDPTLSPEDYRRIKEAEMQREEEARQRRLFESRRPREATCDSRVHLQGIVGNAAIVNGDMFYAGQTAAGARILKIGPNYILVECKGKKYRKVLQ